MILASVTKGWQEIFELIMDVSSLDFEDTVLIIAQYNTLYRDNKKASKSDLEKRGYSKEVIAQVTGKAISEFKPLESCGIKFTKPYYDLKYDYFLYAIQLFEAYEKGILPFSGSLSEQPAQIMDIFSLLGLLKSEREIELAKRVNDERKFNKNTTRHSR